MRSLFTFLILLSNLTIKLNAQIPSDLWFMNFNEGSNASGVILKSNPDSCGFSGVYNFSTAYPTSGTDGAFCEAADGNLYGIIPRGKNEGGMISKFNPTTNEYSIVYFFNGCDFGRVGYPNSELTSGSDYKLYGVTWAGGLNNAGIIFSFDLINNTLTKLHDFDIANGRFPVSKLLLTQDDKLYGMTSSGGDFNLGVIFSYDINSNSYSKILDFNSDNGASPIKNSLTKASNGNLYGMTSQGGINNLGVIFSINPDTDIYTKHFDFSFSNAKYPRANLIEANDGNLYGMAQGGANNSGVIFQFNPINNGYTLKYSLPATFNNPQNSLIQASDGKLYGTGMLNLFSFDYNTSIYTSLFDFTLPNGSILTNEAGCFPNTLIQASNGKMYGNTTLGGSSTLGTFFSFDIGNNSFNKIFDYSSGNNGFSPNQRLIEASNGKLYGACFSGGQYALGTIFCLDPVTHDLETVFNFNDTLGAQPQGSLIAGNDGKLYGMTTYGGGSNAAGVIFSLDPINNVYNILFNFNNLPYLAGRPQGSLIQASNGLLYGMAQWNSEGNDFGNIFSFDPITNQYNELFVFDVISGAYPYGSLMEASNGLLYGMTSRGGVNGSDGNGTLFSFNIETNQFSKIHDFDVALIDYDSTASQGPLGSLVEAFNGKLYGTTRGGGSANSGLLFSFDPSSSEIEIVYEFDDDYNASTYLTNRPAWIDNSLSIGSDGNLYGQTFAIGGGVCNNSFIYRFNPVTNEFREIYEYGVGNIPVLETETVSSCQAFTWNGTTYNQTGTYIWSGTNAAGCDSVVTLNLTIIPQPTQPETACYQTATFNNQTCAWDLSGTQPTQPETACYQTATFNNQICAWELSGTQPTQPPTACYQTATFNNQTCAWELSGTQPTQPETACYQTATFNNQTCAWDLSGTQPTQPETACYQTATFNNQTCDWELTGSPNPLAVTTASACSTYVWTVNGQSYTTSNTYTYFANCQDYQLNLTINPIPTVTFEPDNTTYCNNSGSVDLSGGSPAGGVYSGPGVSNGAFNPAAAGGGLHPVTYTYTNAAGCSNSSSVEFEVAVCTGVEAAAQPVLEVRPNPMESSTFVSLKNYVGSDAQFNLLLMDATGREVFRKTVSAEMIREGYHLQMPELASGTYVLMLNNVSYTGVKRLVK